MEVCLFFSQVLLVSTPHQKLNEPSEPQFLGILLPLSQHVPTILFNSAIVSCAGCKSQKHVLRPESLEGTDEEDPVSAMEWDLLSTDYLLGWTTSLIMFIRDNNEEHTIKLLITVLVFILYQLYISIKKEHGKLK